MAIRHLGETFDIHGGGEDLIFPHHENEIAQSEGATGKEFARYWVHNGLVTIDHEKMSKSLGNFFTIREIFEKFPASAPVTAEILRFFLLSTHYRSPLDFSDEALRQARAGLNNFYDLFKRLEEGAAHGLPGKADWQKEIGRRRMPLGRSWPSAALHSRIGLTAVPAGSGRHESQRPVIRDSSDPRGAALHRAAN